jgi:transposase
VESFPLWEKDEAMPKSKPPNDPEFRARIIDLARSGRSLRSLADEFHVTDQSIRDWLRQADIDVEKRKDGLTSDEKAQLTRLHREVRILRERRDILSKAAAWFAQEAAPTPKKRSDS